MCFIQTEAEAHRRESSTHNYLDGLHGFDSAGGRPLSSLPARDKSMGLPGPAVGKKQPREKRIAVVGGSTAWGYGLTAPQSFPGQLQQRFAARVRSEGGPPINVLNLASNSEGAYSFQYTLSDYDYLDYDAVLIYSGYNDLSQENRFHQSTPIAGFHADRLSPARLYFDGG